MTQDYYDGLRDGVYRFAWMKDGTYYVGTCGTTLKKAYEQIDKEFQADKEISVNTLKMIDSSMENFKKGIVSEPIDTEEIKQTLKRLEENEK